LNGLGERVVDCDAGQLVLQLVQHDRFELADALSAEAELSADGLGDCGSPSMPKRSSMTRRSCSGRTSKARRTDCRCRAEPASAGSTGKGPEKR
jgi:hypothetical protein